MHKEWISVSKNSLFQELRVWGCGLQGYWYTVWLFDITQLFFSASSWPPSAQHKKASQGACALKPAVIPDEAANRDVTQLAVFTHCLAATPTMQQEQKIKMDPADNHGNGSPQQYRPLLLYGCFMAPMRDTGTQFLDRVFLCNRSKRTTSGDGKEPTLVCQTLQVLCLLKVPIVTHRLLC